MNKLSGSEYEQLGLAIRDAYPILNELKKVVRVRLEEELYNIVNTNNKYEHIVDELIDWAEGKGCTEKLIDALYQGNDNNVKLKDIKQKLLPNLFDYTGTSIKKQIFSEEYWKELCLILMEIELKLISNICQITLKNIANNQDILGNYPELINLQKLADLKEILLEKCPENKLGAPTIVEFAERLAKQVNQPERDKLNKWVKDVADELNIKTPTYSDSRVVESVQSYLLITATPKNSSKFNLEAELIPNDSVYSNNKGIKIELNQEEVKVECSWEEITEIISQFINIAEIQHLSKYRNYTLTIELFLPLQYLGKSIDLQEIPINLDSRSQPIGSEYRFVVRSLDRFLKQAVKYFNKLSLRWEALRTVTQEEFKSNFEHFSHVSQCNWHELANNLEWEKRLGLKITCGIPESELEKKELFIAVLKGGVPICLWTRCDNLQNTDIEKEFEQLLTVQSLPDLSHLLESVLRLRKIAHAKQDKAKNYLGYHLGILCDNPDRVPFHLKLEQQLLETGI